MATRQELANDLRRLGVKQGDALVVHSSLRSLGIVEGGAKTVVESLVDVLGPSGLLVFPTFTYRTQVFNPATEPCLTGRIPETGRRWPSAVRSWHPTHSVAAIGEGAQALCAYHHTVDGFSIGSPLDRLATLGGYVLLLGTGHNTNSTVHVGEAHAAVPYLDIPFGPDAFTTAKVVTPNGEIEVSIKYPPGCSKAFGAVEKVLRDRGWVRDGTVGKALVQWVPSQAVIEATVEILRTNPAGLLCTDPQCYRCTQSRLRLHH